MDLAWDRETRLSRMLTIIFLLGVFPVLFFYIGVRFDRAVAQSDGEELSSDYFPADSPAYQIGGSVPFINAY